MNEIKVVCADCKRIIKDGPELNGQVSHGICDDCLFKTKQVLKFRELHPEFDDLEDRLIWIAFKNSRAMALTALAVRMDEFRDAIKQVGISAADFIKGINEGFKKLKGNQ